MSNEGVSSTKGPSIKLSLTAKSPPPPQLPPQEDAAIGKEEELARPSPRDGFTREDSTQPYTSGIKLKIRLNLTSPQENTPADVPNAHSEGEEGSDMSDGGEEDPHGRYSRESSAALPHQYIKKKKPPIGKKRIRSESQRGPAAEPPLQEVPTSSAGMPSDMAKRPRLDSEPPEAAPSGNRSRPHGAQKNRWMPVPKPLPEVLLKVLDTLQRKDMYGFFLEPVNTVDVPDYLTVIKEPMDLGTMSQKAESNQYSSFEQFEHDFHLVVKNAMTFNDPASRYYKEAERLLNVSKDLFARWRHAWIAPSDLPPVEAVKEPPRRESRVVEEPVYAPPEVQMVASAPPKALSSLSNNLQLIFDKVHNLHSDAAAFASGPNPLPFDDPMVAQDPLMKVDTVFGPLLADFEDAITAGMDELLGCHFAHTMPPNDVLGASALLFSSAGGAALSASLAAALATVTTSLFAPPQIDLYSPLAAVIPCSGNLDGTSTFSTNAIESQYVDPDFVHLAEPERWATPLRPIPRRKNKSTWAYDQVWSAADGSIGFSGDPFDLYHVLSTARATNVTDYPIASPFFREAQLLSERVKLGNGQLSDSVEDLSYRGLEGRRGYIRHPLGWWSTKEHVLCKSLEDVGWNTRDRSSSVYSEDALLAEREERQHDLNWLNKTTEMAPLHYTQTGPISLSPVAPPDASTPTDDIYYAFGGRREEAYVRSLETWGRAFPESTLITDTIREKIHHLTEGLGNIVLTVQQAVAKAKLDILRPGAANSTRKAPSTLVPTLAVLSKDVTAMPYGDTTVHVPLFMRKQELSALLPKERSELARYIAPTTPVDLDLICSAMHPTHSRWQDDKAIALLDAATTARRASMMKETMYTVADVQYLCKLVLQAAEASHLLSPDASDDEQEEAYEALSTYMAERPKRITEVLHAVRTLLAPLFPHFTEMDRRAYLMNLNYKGNEEGDTEKENTNVGQRLEAVIEAGKLLAKLAGSLPPMVLRSRHPTEMQSIMAKQYVIPPEAFSAMAQASSAQEASTEIAADQEESMIEFDDLVHLSRPASTESKTSSSHHSQMDTSME